MDSYKLKDTEQTKRMKQLSLNDAYSCSGELHKLLNYASVHNLVKKIKERNVKLTSNLLYGRSTITTEERFLENLNKYIGYVRNHYFIDHIEQFCLIELSLRNKYSNILFDLRDFHNDENYNYYYDGFRKMFLYNFYDNIYYYSKYSERNSILRKFVKKFEKYDFNNNEDILVIEKELTKVITAKNNNLFNAFVPHKEIKDKNIDFFICQTEWVLAERYKNRKRKIWLWKKKQK